MYNVPNTGDDTNLTLYISMLVIAMIIMIGIGIYGFFAKKGNVIDDNDNKEFKYSVGSEESSGGITLKKGTEAADEKGQFGVTISMEDIELKDVEKIQEEKKDK